VFKPAKTKEQEEGVRLVETGQGTEYRRPWTLEIHWKEVAGVDLTSAVLRSRFDERSLNPRVDLLPPGKRSEEQEDNSR
jgi:hypothetical protein